MTPHLKNIKEKLAERKSENALRELKVNENLVDFCSNDYLGFAGEAEIHILDELALKTYGATGSRLISGNHKITEEVEAFLANYYKAESALIFNSGYNANIGFFSCLPQRGDTIVYDELIHASIRDGIRLSNANSFSFKHNNVLALEEKIKNAKGRVWIAVESIYSMDGDEAPLKALVKMSKKYTAALIVDEAHACGVFGDKGEGLVAQYGLENKVFARIATFGKAFGTHGSVVLGSKLLRDYLINYSRAFIYTTALPLPSVLAIKKAHTFLANNLDRIQELRGLISYFKFKIQNSKFKIVESRSSIQCLIVSGNNEVKQLADSIQNKGFDVRPILSPTVPKGKERLRICLHAFNTKEQIDRLVNVLMKTSPLEGRSRGVTSHSNNYYNKDLKPLARKKRQEMTKAEVKIWNDLLRKKQCFGYRFLRQRSILNYIVDFMCPELKLIVEIDGYSHHFEDVYVNDVKRQKKIEDLGYTFIRFTDNEIMNDFNNVLMYFENLPLRRNIEG